MREQVQITHDGSISDGYIAGCSAANTMGRAELQVDSLDARVLGRHRIMVERSLIPTQSSSDARWGLFWGMGVRTGACAQARVVLVAHASSSGVLPELHTTQVKGTSV